MKTVSEEKKPKKGVRSADWKESINLVLEKVDSQLKAHGLQIVQIDTGTDEYEWFIEERPKK